MSDIERGRRPLSASSTAVQERRNSLRDQSGSLRPSLAFVARRTRRDRSKARESRVPAASTEGANVPSVALASPRACGRLSHQLEWIGLAVEEALPIARFHPSVCEACVVRADDLTTLLLRWSATSPTSPPSVRSVSS